MLEGNNSKKDNPDGHHKPGHRIFQRTFDEIHKTLTPFYDSDGGALFDQLLPLDHHLVSFI